MHHDLAVVEPQGGNITLYLSDLLGLVAERQVQYVMTIQIFPSNPLPVACPITKLLTLHFIMQIEANVFGNSNSQQIRNA